MRCRITSGGGDPRESATESKPPEPGLGLEKYEAAFCDNAIDEKVLPHLTVEDLKEIGVAAVGDRRKLLAAIAALGGVLPPKPAPAPETALAKSPRISAERRPITVMFCDLVGSTSLEVGTEGWRRSKASRD